MSYYEAVNRRVEHVILDYSTRKQNNSHASLKEMTVTELEQGLVP